MSADRHRGVGGSRTPARRGWILAALVAAVVMGLRSPAAQQPVFRANADALWVTATVVDRDGHLVTDLDERDFEVTDNGVPRDIVTFRHDVVPFALTIMLDLSGSMADNFTTVRRAIAALVDRFEPGDRVTMGAFETVPTIGTGYSANPRTILRWATDAEAGTLPICTGKWLDAGNGMDVKARLMTHGSTALWDGLACGIEAAASDAETPRRVVLVVTDGVDHVSATTPVEVLQQADEYGVMIYAVGMVGSEGLQGNGLRGIAEQTGGGYLQLTASSDVIDAFAHIADELRHQYVFGVMPDGPIGGRHVLAVRVRRPDVTTRSRRVYLVPAPAVTVPPAPDARAPGPSPPAGSTAPRAGGVPVEATPFDRYANGDASSVPATRMTRDDLRRWSGTFRRAAELWIKAGGPAEESRRRLVVATYALQAMTAQSDERLWSERQPAFNLVEWASSLLRKGPPSSGERIWHEAAVAQLERFRALRELDRLIGHEHGRFPNDEHWVLARAICEDLNTWPEVRDGTRFDVDPAIAARITARYTEAAALTSVRQEALLRLGYFELRRGRVEQALAHFSAVGEPGDVFLRYLLHLFQGRALEQAHRRADAIAAYRQATRDVPFAQSATLELAAALVEDQRGPEATKLVTQMLEVPASGDPWIIYTMPDARFWPAAMRALREAIKP